MSDTSGRTHSVWLEDVQRPSFESLRHSSKLESDVIVVGGGISGLTSAYLLRKEGKTVALLDDGEIGSGETGRTTAHLASGLDDRFYRLLEEHGEIGALRAYHSHSEAIDQIEQIVKEHNIDCEFKRVDAYLFQGDNDKSDTLNKELEALQSLGIPHESVDNYIIEGTPSFGRAIRFPNQAQFHPMKYLSSLAKICEDLGVEFFTHSHVDKFVTSKDHVEVSTPQGNSLRGKSLVVATNVPVNDKFVMFSKLHSYRTYAIGVQIPKGSMPSVLMWDTDDPYHYVRMTPHDDKHDLLIVGGEDHLTGHEHDYNERFSRLIEWTKWKFQMVGSVTHSWSGQIIEPVDSLGFNGRNPRDSDNVFIITGDSGNGLTNGTLGAAIVTDLIMGRENKYASLYNPSRKMIDEAKDFVKENLKVNAKYLDWIKGSQTNDEKKIPKGEGAIMRVGVKKEAVYKDEEGHVYRMSAVCPHMKGIVNWNPLEKTWECPVHGSRFDRFGQVINGPSNHNLKPMDFPPSHRSSSARHHLFEEVTPWNMGRVPHVQSSTPLERETGQPNIPKRSLGFTPNRFQRYARTLRFIR